MRIDIHHWIHHCDDSGLTKRVERLEAQGEVMSETVDAIKAQYQLLRTAFTGISADVASLKQKIEDLANGGNGATQAQLEDLLAEATSLASSFTALDAETTQDPPPGA